MTENDLPRNVRNELIRRPSRLCAVVDAAIARTLTEETRQQIALFRREYEMLRQESLNSIGHLLQIPPFGIAVLGFLSGGAFFAAAASLLPVTIGVQTLGIPAVCDPRPLHLAGSEPHGTSWNLREAARALQGRGFSGQDVG